MIYLYLGVIYLNSYQAFIMHNKLFAVLNIFWCYWAIKHLHNSPTAEQKEKGRKKLIDHMNKK